MAAPSFGRDRKRLYCFGFIKSKRIKLRYLLFGGFFVIYLTFLVHWQPGDFSYFKGLVPTEQLSNLRKANHLVHIHRKDALGVKNAVQTKERRRNEYRNPLEGVPPTAALVATTIAAMTEKPRTIEKIAINQQLNPVVALVVQRTEATAVVESLPAPVAPHSIAAIVEPVVAPGTPHSAAVLFEPVAPKPAAAVVEPVVAPCTPYSAAFKTGFVPSVAEAPVPLVTRNQTVSGYAETVNFLKNYHYDPNESLFLFFVCSDDEFKANDWSQECVVGKQHVYDAFSKSPGRNRLVTVFAGSDTYWKYQNDFYQDNDLKIKGVPTIIKWEGRSGRTSGMLLQTSLYDKELIEYLFWKTGKPEQVFPAETVATKQIVTVHGYDAFVDAMTKFEEEINPVPTFLMMIAGRFEANKRPWCPYCRYSELPVEYAFYAFAPKNSRLIRVEVTNSYAKWNGRSAFSEDPNLQLQVVPLMIKIDHQRADLPHGSNNVKFIKHKFRYDRLTPLREFFSSYV